MQKCINLSIGKTMVTKEYDDNPDYSYLEQSNLGFEERLREFKDGGFFFIGIVVRTELISEIPTNPGKYFEMSDNVISSLWGIESDSGTDYIDLTINDLKAENKAELLKMGFTESEIDESLNNAEEVE